MVFKNLFQSIEKGVGIGIGLLIVAAFAFGVYAFVEPSSGPSSDFYFDSNSPLVSNYSLSFVGYVTGENADFGGLKGANTLCDTAFEGSRWMTYDDLLRMGNLYNYTYEVWIPDARGPDRYPRDNSFYSAYGSNSIQWTCGGFTSASGSYQASTLLTTGYLTNANCNEALAIACVRGQ